MMITFTHREEDGERGGRKKASKRKKDVGKVANPEEINLLLQRSFLEPKVSLDKKRSQQNFLTSKWRKFLVPSFSSPIPFQRERAESE